jgi:hypothetical protein
MKTLVGFRYLITGIIGIVIGIVFVAYKQQDAAEKYKRHRAEYCESLGSTSQQKKECIEKGTSATDYLPWGYELVRWPGGITTWAIIATLFVIGWQSFETKNAARAALLNAKALINAERPWIVMVIEPQTTMGGFAVHVKNKGRTPARVVAAYMGWVAVEGISNLPQDPPYGPGSLMQDRMVVADETVWAVWFHREMMRKDLGGDFEKALDGKRQIFVFGKVLYRDVLNPEIILPYETRWIGLFEINEEGDAIHRAEGIGAAPKGYEKYT